jgi:hypothetical protein
MSFLSRGFEVFFIYFLNFRRYLKKLAGVLGPLEGPGGQKIPQAPEI